MPTNAQTTLLFYGSYAVLNTVLFFFSNLLLLLFLWDWKNGISYYILPVIYSFLILVLTLSTYVVTPYDQLAYFLMFVGFLSVRLRTSWISYLVLAFAAVAVGSIAKQSSCSLPHW
jgi:hypothetical protein